MTISGQLDRRNVDVAFRVNAHLARDAQMAILAEGERVIREVLQPRRLNDRTVLLVGGAGYVGSVLAGHLLDRGYRVRCLDLALYGNAAATSAFDGHERFTFVHADFADGLDFDSLFAEVTDVVILGALVGDPITRKYAEPTRAINLDGTLRFLEGLDGRGLNKVVFLSTCSNYGLIEGAVAADEEFPLNPLSLYAETKVAVEKEVLSLAGAVDHRACVLRFATAFGLSPRMRFDLTISEFVRETWLGRELIVYDADTWRPYCHVADFAEAIRRVLEAPVEAVDFEVFNVGSDANNFTKRDIVAQIREFIPHAHVRYIEHGADARNYRVDFAKIRERLSFAPEYSVATGIAELIEALGRGEFADVDTQPNFYGNRVIDYP